jgi:hypothetical protein
MAFSFNPVMAGRIQKAWDALTPEQRNKIQPVVLDAHRQAFATVQGNAPVHKSDVPHALLLVHSILTKDSDNLLMKLSTVFEPRIAADGTMIGTGKYETYDPGWLESAAIWLENIPRPKARFQTAPATIKVPDSLLITLAGDWGTGNWRSSSNPAPCIPVASRMTSLSPDITIHLGDVYYSGTSDEEQHLLVDLWPKGKLGALALNSNHEMYSAAEPYFQLALQNPLFALQQGCSYFALENSNWVIVGLDSSYYSDESELYMRGSLGSNGVQIDFLKMQVAKGKRIIVLTHHNGLLPDGSAPEQQAGRDATLWDQVISAFPTGAGPDHWFWAHVHAGIAYTPQGPGNILCRCVGHSALPQGSPAGILQGKPNVSWFESRPAHDPLIPERILNGFVALSFDGPRLSERYYDENGTIAWS